MFGTLLSSVLDMKSLPFVVQPRKQFVKVQIGDKKTGIIEIERRGYLSVSEKAFVDGVTQGTDGISSIVSLATRIGTKTKHTTEDAFNAVMKAIQGDTEDRFAAKIREDYSDELGNILTQMADSLQKRTIAAATILIRSRIDADWTVDDTLDQDPALIQAIADFYTQEENGYFENEVNDDKQGQLNEAVEIVGKSTEENGAN